MNKKWLPMLLIVLSVMFAFGMVFSVVMAVTAVRFCEWGRLLLYGCTSVVCLEAMILSIGKLRNKDMS